MSSEKEMDLVSDRVSIMGLPEVFYGFNHLYIANKDLDILLDFNAVDSLSFSGFEKRKKFFNSEHGKNYFEEKTKDDAAVSQDDATNDLTQNMEKLLLDLSYLSEDEKDINIVDVIPPVVQVAQAGFWKKKDKSKIKDYKELVETSDWTYSTAYKGTTRYLTMAAKRIFEETSLELPCKDEKCNKGLSLVNTP